MSTRKTPAAVGLWLLLLAWALPGRAGLVIHYQDGGGAAPKVVYLQGNKLRQEMGAMAFILDLDRNRLCYLNSRRRVYWAGPVERLLHASRQAAQRRLEKMLQHLPPSRRQAIRQALERPQPPPPADTALPITVKDTGQRTRIAGYLCQRYDVLTRGHLLMSLWMAPALKVTAEIDPARLAAMMARMGRLGGRRSPLCSPQVQALWHKGYPLKQVNYGPAGPSTAVARRVESKPLPPALFAPPPGWRAAPLWEVMP